MKGLKEAVLAGVLVAGSLAGTASAAAYDFPIHTSGVDTTYFGAFQDAAIQGADLCSVDGGTVIHVEAFSAEQLGSRWLVNVVTICRIP